MEEIVPILTHKLFTNNKPIYVNITIYSSPRSFLALNLKLVEKTYQISTIDYYPYYNE